VAGTALARTPNYSFADAGRYLRMPPSTVRAWAKGTVVTKPRGRVHFKQVLDGPPRAALTFVDLAELLMVRELRERFNVTLQAIRNAKAYTAREFGKPRYLFDLHVWGREIFVRQFAPTPVSISRSGQMALADFIDHLLQRVQVDEVGLPRVIFPRLTDAHSDRPIQISPAIAFGYPTIAGTAIRTATVTARYDAGESIEHIAWDHDLTPAQVKDAISFQVAA
jgi:uncharacterized protein (DUF433 family)